MHLRRLRNFAEPATLRCARLPHMDIFWRMTAPDLAEQTKSTAPSSDAGLPPRPAEAPGQVAPTKRRQTWIGLQRAAQLSAIGIFVILLGAFLQAARVVVMPVA